MILIQNRQNNTILRCYILSSNKPTSTANSVIPYDKMRLKVAEHSFQEPIPNSPLLLSYVCFGARFLQESRLITEKFILAFWLRYVLLPW